MLIDIIKSAIYQKKELLLKVKSDQEPNQFVEVLMQPYVLGDDILQYEFVWGYLTDKQVFYKVLTDLIISAEAIEIPYTVIEDATYDYSIGEEHFCVLEGLGIKYAEANTFVS